ncbi:MAG: hypothetical protein IKS94_06890 [Prevotella sp.]|nr:hypothetical protein [Prevotella sp.]
MNPLDLAYINRRAPYKVWVENGRDFLIETSYDLLFRIGFMDDYTIWPTGAYQFTINNESKRPSPNDEKLKVTVFCIIEAFFVANPDILLYICETGDGKQAFRSRLFVRWFNTYNNHDAYVMQTAEVDDGENRNFAALIVQKSNPRLTEIVAEFDETIKLLTEKPSEE